MSDGNLGKWLIGGISAVVAAWAMRDGYACLGRIQTAAIRYATKLLPEEHREDAFCQWSQDIAEAWPTELMRTLMALDAFRAALVMRLHFKKLARSNADPRRQLLSNLVSVIILATAAQVVFNKRAAKGERGFRLALQRAFARSGYLVAMFVLYRCEKSGRLKAMNFPEPLYDAAETIDRTLRLVNKQSLTGA